MATGKEGDKRGWSEKNQTGYILERHNGKLIWVQYFQGRPAGIWKGKGLPGVGNIDLTGHLSNAYRFIQSRATQSKLYHYMKILALKNFIHLVIQARKIINQTLIF